jgi:hypothetical protein
MALIVFGKPSWRRTMPPLIRGSLSGPVVTNQYVCGPPYFWTFQAKSFS